MRAAWRDAATKHLTLAANSQIGRNIISAFLANEWKRINEQFFEMYKQQQRRIRENSHKTNNY